MSTNIKNITGRMERFGLRFWLILLFVALLVFGANFFFANRSTTMSTR